MAKAKHTLAGATAFGALMTYLHPKMAIDAKSICRRRFRA